ncbi:MAG: hypothetical protein M3R55_16910 [Acidobacteriota bacterium]|nr:hypothetical protein [Acidobacteriota bacterium]
MNSHLLRALLIAPALLLADGTATAQDIPSSCTGYERLAVESRQIEKGHFKLLTKVELTCDGFKFFADEVDVFTQEDRLVAVGNVLFTTAETRISAAKLEFNLKTKTGVFYDATGSSKVKPTVGAKSMFGTQEADMHFHGEKIEKLGPSKYRLTRGGFTTCLQPTARWEFTSGSVTINLDRYAIAKNTVFRVKGVPLLYLPVIYYPLDDDNRSTGFLLPGYGNSLIHGQTLRNAFFWAINRSMDATVTHNWFSKSGQSVGAQFRYVASPASNGILTGSFVNETASVTTFPDGQTFSREAARNYQVDGQFIQALPGNFRAGGQINYFSDLSVEQLYQYNPYDVTNRQSYIDANVSGQAAGLQLGAVFARRQYFSSGTASSLTGSKPRVTVSRAEQPIGRLPVYWGFNAEGIQIISQTINGTQISDRGRGRVDFVPTLRAPLTRLTWLNLSTSLSYRATWWSRSLDETTGAIVEVPLSRRHYEMQVNATGPIFNRVFLSPGSRFAQRWKHVIEPSATFSRASPITISKRILTDYDSVDLVAGDITRMDYAFTNRLYMKQGEGAAGRVREFASVVVNQSYYTDSKAAAEDQVARNPSGLHFPRSNFSPISATASLTPIPTVTLGFRTQYEKISGTFRQLSAGGTLKVSRFVDLNGSWSKQRQPKDSPYASSPYYNSHSVSGTSTFQSERNTFGGSYNVHYDIRNSGFLNQRLTAYYNAQCCGVGIEYQKINLPNYDGRQGGVLDRRFNLSFTLAGIGSFSDFFGAFGADPYRR